MFHAAPFGRAAHTADMDANTPTPHIDDLYKLVLADGVQLERDGKPVVPYRTVHLRETTVGDERAALRMAERAVLVQGEYKLLVSDADFRYAMTLRHIEALECDGVRLPQAMLGMDVLDKLSPHDLQLIEQRIFLIEMAAQLRYGVITQEQFAAIMGGVQQPHEVAAPKPAGQAAPVGHALAATGPVPAMLADYAGAPAHGAGAGHGGQPQ